MDTKTAREIFVKDRFATNAASIVIDHVADDRVRCSMKITPEHLNAAGGVMGGAIFTLADFVFAIASNSDPDVAAVAADAHIRFLAPPAGTCLMGESAMLRRGYKSCVAEVTVTDDTGRLIARVSFGGSLHHK